MSGKYDAYLKTDYWKQVSTAVKSPRSSERGPVEAGDRGNWDRVKGANLQHN